MNVVLEGADGGGKSTLAAKLSASLGLRIQQGSGPPKAPGEIEARARSYLLMKETLFDRHPCVSQEVYGALRGETLSEELMSLVLTFYRSKPLIIYCRSTSPDLHVVKQGEDPAHVATLVARYDELRCMYDAWALRKATLIYRIGDDVDALTDIVRVMAG